MSKVVAQIVDLIDAFGFHLRSFKKYGRKACDGALRRYSKMNLALYRAPFPTPNKTAEIAQLFALAEELIGRHSDEKRFKCIKKFGNGNRAVDFLGDIFDGDVNALVLKRCFAHICKISRLGRMQTVDASLNAGNGQVESLVCPPCPG